MQPLADYVIPEIPDFMLDESALSAELRARSAKAAVQRATSRRAAAVPARPAVPDAKAAAERVALAARAAHLAILHPARSRGNAVLLSPEFDGSVALRGRELATSADAATAGFVSLQRFHGARRGDDIASLNAFAWADLEIGPTSPFRGLPPEIVAGIVLQRLDDAGVPRPSYVLHSGRGLWLVWLSETPLPPSVKGRVRRALRSFWGEAVTTGRGAGSDRVRAKAAAMAGLWEGLDLDRAVGDLARVHRVAGSINPKSGERVRLVWPDSWADVERQDFEPFADAVLPYTRAETEAYLAERDADREARRARAEAEGRPVAERRVRIAYGRHAAIEQDLMRLALHLGPERLEAMRIRTLMAHHISCARARAGMGGDAASWAAELAPLVGLSEKALRTALRPVEQRLRRHEAGETVEYRGRQVSPLYWHRDDTIMMELGLTEALAREAGLSRLIPGTDARVSMTAAERMKHARRRAGAVARGQHAVTLSEVARLAREISTAADLPVAEIAALLDCSRATVYRALKAYPEAPAPLSEAVDTVSVPLRTLSVGVASPVSPPAAQALPAPAADPEPIPAWIKADTDPELARLYPLFAADYPLPGAQKAFQHADRLQALYWHHLATPTVEGRSSPSTNRREALMFALWILQGEVESGTQTRGLRPAPKAKAKPAPRPRRPLRMLGHCPSPATRLH
ncbi:MULTISPECIES: helix-turn-helix domain-containing protein [unclassified Methylobacterium]|uniref:helix-turn-helix domain-containing protein n=1 Tax=unclassified Methylobacterium TaxID=2615210 RepID=UPI0005B8557A|nr:MULTISPECIES: helix-turn-helix domain-containing protein [unclassified Methylobacterium]SFU50700.1 Homeodomain-like domain-containing protein [Methylobacterium sp. UNCCL125]